MNQPDYDIPPNLPMVLQQHFDTYLHDLQGQSPTDLHSMMLAVCEKPLLAWVMDKTNHNQSLASQWLGINRATLRKKLQQHQLL